MDRATRAGGDHRQRIAVGVLCGLTTGAVLALLMLVEDVDSVSLLPIGPAPVQVLLHLVAAGTIGAVFGEITPRVDRAHAALVSSGLILGLLWWSLGPLTIVPLVRGDGTMWSLDEATPRFSNLVAALLHGSLTGLCSALARSFGPLTDRLATTRLDDPTDPPTRIVIVGGGFGGVAVAQRLEHHALAGSGLDVTLISDRNYLLFTPMLAEVAASAVEPQHISAPLRSACSRTRFVRGRVTAVNTETRTVRVSDAPRHEVPYDHLVLAVGSVTDSHDLPGVAEHCFTLKSLDDATDLRNHVITMMERADVETDEVERRRQLTFTVAGGGFAGTEMIAELCDLAYSALRHYPSVPIGELRFVLVHSRDRILPEIGPELAGYALEKLHARDIETVLETRVERVTADALVLDDGTEVPTRTVVWTAGNRPHPLVADIDCDHDDAGALVADATLAVAGADRIWALGDCARVPDPDSDDGGHCPPTAQHATRQGTTLADNIVALERGRNAEPFTFSSLGTLVALGHRTAVAEIRGRRFAGIVAWFMWRTIYLFKLPGLEKKARVVVDWSVDLVFPRDIVLASHGRDRNPGEPTEPAASPMVEVPPSSDTVAR
ncbi:MAG: NAD(P)/FAD-dependent oxidoreductase [Ilumatobacter sp.]|uniref:NAD(P)/FAD-dependent oxidoreductase n=1 Tax=Ilumatobacter sp. TaxID=1967498 RepID=UPI003C709629